MRPSAKPRIQVEVTGEHMIPKIHCVIFDYGCVLNLPPETSEHAGLVEANVRGVHNKLIELLGGCIYQLRPERPEAFHRGGLPLPGHRR